MFFRSTNSCENYLSPVYNQQCGNGDFINEPIPFGGYYQPPFDCPEGFYWPPYFGTLPPENPGGGDPTGPDMPSSSIPHDMIPEEYEKSQAYLESLKDKKYIEEQIQKSKTTDSIPQ